MFRIIAIIAYAAVFGGIILHRLIFPCGHEKRYPLLSLIRKQLSLFTQIFSNGKLSLAGKIRKCAFLLGLLCFAVLALSGFGPLLFGHRLEGYLLMIHATFAPVFIACTALVAITGAAQYAFNKKDTGDIPCPCWKLPNRAGGCWLTDSGIGVKAGFWVLIVMSLPVTLTMVMSMFPLFGTRGQEFLFHAHRGCALVFVLTVIVELYMLIRMEVLRDVER